MNMSTKTSGRRRSRNRASSRFDHRMRFVEPRKALPTRNRTGFHSRGGTVRLTQ